MADRPLTFISSDTVFLYLVNGFSDILGTNVHHVSGYCWKGFQGQRSKVKVIARQNAPPRVSLVWTV